MTQLSRITFDPAVIGGKPCIRGMRITVGTIVGLLAAGHTAENVLNAYPLLEPQDLQQALVTCLISSDHSYLENGIVRCGFSARVTERLWRQVV